MTNKIIRIEIDANLNNTQIIALIQVELDTVNLETGTVVGYDEDFNSDSYIYVVSIAYTTP